MLHPTYRKKQIEKIAKKSLLRTKKFYHRTLYIDNQITNIKIIKISNDKELFENVAPKKTYYEDTVYLLEKRLSLFNGIIEPYFRTNFDMICCDSSFNIVGWFENVTDYKNIECPNSTFNIWICKNGFIKHYDIKNKKFMTTKPIYNKTINPI